MSKKQKKPVPASQAAHNRPGGTPAPRSGAPRSEEAEPVAERRPIPVFLIILLVGLIYLGDMYIMDHGADVMGKAGPFPSQLFDPYQNYQEVMDKNPESEEDKLLKIGKAKFEMFCAPCHASSGLGNPGTGIPPLLGSEWVKTPGAGRSIRIVLHAVRGPILVGGKTFDNPGMLAWAPTLSDEDIAGILTYVRANNDWGNKASAVKPDAVKKVRGAYSGRNDPWSAEELLKVPETE